MDHRFEAMHESYKRSRYGANSLLIILRNCSSAHGFTKNHSEMVTYAGRETDCRVGTPQRAFYACLCAWVDERTGGVASR